VVVFAVSGNIDLEERLRLLMNPVSPDPEFVNNLKTRLATSPSVALERRSRQSAVVLLAGGLFLGALIVWLFHRLREV